MRACLQQAGHPIDPASLAGISAYLRHHIDRFGVYPFDPARQPLPLADHRFDERTLHSSSDAPPMTIRDHAPLWEE